MQVMQRMGVGFGEERGVKKSAGKDSEKGPLKGLLGRGERRDKAFQMPSASVHDACVMLSDSTRSTAEGGSGIWVAAKRLPSLVQVVPLKALFSQEIQCQGEQGSAWRGSIRKLWRPPPFRSSPFQVLLQELGFV
jgi:hypothetical protein